jgi:DDE domain
MVQRFTPELIDAARPNRHIAGDRWFIDETYLKVAGQWKYLYRAIDQHGQVIDVLASPKRDLAATRQFFTRALNAARGPTEVTTDRAPAYPRVLDELVPEAWHVVEQYANNPRSRSRPDEGPNATDARPETHPLRPGGLSRARVRSEPAPWTLRPRPRYRARPQAGGDLQRTRPCHLNSASIARGHSSSSSPTQQRRSS